jgi:hypothetical protein
MAVAGTWVVAGDSDGAAEAGDETDAVAGASVAPG